MKLTDEERLALNCLSTETPTPTVRVGRVVWPAGNTGDMVLSNRAKLVLSRLSAYGLVRWVAPAVMHANGGRGGWVRVGQ